MRKIRRGTRHAALFLAACVAPKLAQAQSTFVVTDTSVRHGPFEAVATSRDTILSSYPRAGREIRFRFSINGKENEFPPGTEHTIYLHPHEGRLVTSVYTFSLEGDGPPPVPTASTGSEEGVAQVTFRVDLGAVERSLREKGYYDPPLGARIMPADLAHVYVLGDPAPLSWDYGALHPGVVSELSDPDSNGVFEGTVPIEAQYTRPRAADGRAVWARNADLSAFPSLTSSQRMQDALYRLSLEELTQLVREDGALSAGAKWPGVWTRDISLSAILSLAIVAPDATKRSLLAKVDSAGRIIQDTGTGGSWPVSSDRMVWALAAWEIYAATGDRAWLKQAYEITKRSALADLHAVRDARTGLFDGESSFMDWREQSYPRWMQPADIYQSQNLGTNAVHYAAYRVLANEARALGEPAARWDSVALGIQRGMTALLWQPQQGWYAQYRYGRNSYALSPRAEGLGESLASIYGAASRAQRRSLMTHAPVTEYGTPSFWPYIPGERFYHNATIWPFVTAYWSWAAAEGGNTLAVQRGLDAATRSTALFLTNKENTVASTGHFEGTALDSDRQLWSVAGTLASTYRLLFGMRLEPERLVFRPMVPPSYAGDRTLAGFHYRGSTLTISVHGYGDAVASARVDGHAMRGAEVPASLTGAHTVDITMNKRWPGTQVNLVPSRFAPYAPRVVVRGDSLAWTAVPEAVRYVVYRDGRAVARTTRTGVAVHRATGLREYQVLAENTVGDQSFLSEPVRVVAAADEQIAKPSGGMPYIRLTRDTNVTVTIPVTVARAGTYAIDARYANGNGPINTEDKVAVRTLVVDGDTAGVLVFPQRGTNNWTDWGWTNSRHVHLSAGRHIVTLTFTPLDENMNRHENTALLDGVRVTRLSTEP